MKVILTEILSLMMVNLPFEFYFASGNKNKADSGYAHWFTPSGKCRIHFGSCHVDQRGRYTPEDYKALVKAMKKYKCDILTDGRDYYTIADGTLAIMGNMSTIIYQAHADWEAQKNAQLWDNKKEYVEDTKTINI